MAERVYRTQLLLRPEQHRRLLLLSREEGKSISEVARSLIDEALIGHQNTVWEARSRAIERLRVLRRSIVQAGAAANGDLVEDSRNEREDERP